jgi:ABC-2 type transport system permease protein
MRHPLIQLAIAHIKEYLREPGALFWSIGFPVLMALGLGLAFSGNKEMVRSVALVPSGIASDTLFSHALFQQAKAKTGKKEIEFESAYGKTKYVFQITSFDSAQLMLKRGRVSSIVTEKGNRLVFHSDPMNPEAELVSMQLEPFFHTGKPGIFEGNLEKLKAKGTRYIDFLVPGLLGMGIMMSVMWGVCYTLIEKRNKKLLRRMVATPMKKSHFLLAQWGSRIMMMVFEATVLIVFSVLFFDIEIQGSLGVLVLMLLAGNFCFFGLAILISSRTANLQLGNGLISIVTTPMMVLSGIFFSYQNFPPLLIKVIKALPLTQLVDNLRAIFNEGAGFSQILPGFIILIVSGIVCFLIGLRVYKWY